MPTLKKGDQVRIKIKKDDAWGERAVVVGTAKTPRSYNVQTETGILRRKGRHLLRIPRDEREKPKEVPPGSKPTQAKRREQENSRNAETPVETIVARSEGIRTRFGRLSIPPDRQNL